MSKSSKKRKQFENRQKARRREKLTKLERRYFAAPTRREERAIIDKIVRLAPDYPVREILRPAA